MESLNTMSAGEFVRRLKDQVGEPDHHYVFWLGAGCSVTSGIPAAAALVRDDWLPRLARLKDVASTDVAEWAQGEFEIYDVENPGALYGAVMNELFHLPHLRQRETERLCDSRVPGFGYGVLASLMSRDDGFFSAALTTNFDDLVADAMYVFGDRRPLVVHHQALASFVRPGQVRRPLVVKVHGDHRLNPMHTPVETENLESSVATGIQGLLRDRGLIFIGYAGNDHGVIATLESLPLTALPLGVWWVSRDEPRSPIRPWLEERNAVWVRADGFDELMLLFREEFDIEHPTAEKFDRMFKKYRAAYEELSARVADLPGEAPDAGALKEAARRATEAATSWWGVELEARRCKTSDPKRADRIYREGIKRFPDAALFGNYANFLTEALGEHDRAQEMYERALAIDPDEPDYLTNYATFLTEIRGEHDRARELYEQAIANDPTEATALGNYAVLVSDVHGNQDLAASLLRRAVNADPSDPNQRANYARLLFETGDDDSALTHAEVALEHAGDEVDIRAEVLMYLLVLGPTEDRVDVLTQIAQLVRSGGRSPGWDFSRILARAREEHDPRVEFLETLADVISERKDASELERFEEWPKT